MFDLEIDELGQRLGMPGLRLNKDGVTGLAIEGLGTLSLERVEKDYKHSLLIVFSWPVEASDTEQYLQLLKRIHWKNRPEMQTQAAMHADRIIVSVRFAEEAVTAAGLENALRYLTQLKPRHSID